MSRRIWLDPWVRGRPRRYIEIEPRRHFAEVTLNRDDYVFTAQSEDREEDVAVRPEFAEALRWCLDTATDYLWAQGYGGSFVYSTGPHFITVYVPFGLASEAAEALRAAEIDGDMGALDALTEKLTLPLDTWLGPGERELVQGVDFAGGPTRFLEFLRKKAQERGLRLNGRAAPGTVWVRPQMPEHIRLGRERYPELYSRYADPTPYVEYQEPDDAPVRPYLGERTRNAPTHPVTPVTFVDTPVRLSQRQKCSCGFPTGQDEGRHAQWHMRWSTGVPIPRNLTWFGGSIAVVTTTSPPLWRKLAYECALLPKRENGYDFASFSGDGEPSEINLRAYLYCIGDRVVGFVSALDTSTAAWDSFEPSTTKSRAADGTLRPAVNVIFTAETWRRQGIARALVQAMAADAKVAVTDVAWTTPFSPAGRALASSFDPAGAWFA